MRAGSVVAASLLLSIPATATWTIVAVRESTGEVCIAGATCLSQVDLRGLIAVVVPGEGVGAAQSSVDTSGRNRGLIWNGIQLGKTPQEILDELADHDNQHETRQYGIVSFDGPPVTFTGTGAGFARFGVTGQVDDILYAIQGNVLAGNEVVLAAEEAFVHSQRDLGQRAMSAMEGARRFGGDGRCSCSQTQPDSCGSPPPSFEKSAHAAFIVVARIGDTLGTCDSADGCATGDYYLRKQVASAAILSDPVRRLTRRYNKFRLDMRGVPDHIHSSVEPAAERLVADGVTSTQVTVRLADIDAEPLTRGGQVLEVVPTSPGPPVALVGPIVDNGDGTHTFSLTATTNPGSGSWRVEVTQGNKTVWLYPELVVDVDPLVELHAGYTEIASSEAPTVPFVLNVPSAAGSAYNLIGSAAGTSPGITIGGQYIPLNRDRLFGFSYLLPSWPLFPGSMGQLDGNGRAEAALSLGSASLAELAGRQLDFVALLAGPGTVTSGVSVTVVP